MMKRIIPLLLGLVCIGALSGCKYAGKNAAAGSSDMMGFAAAGEKVDGMMIWKANLSIEVRNVNSAVNAALALAEREGGFVEQKSDRGVESADLTLRIPVKTFKEAVAGLEALGKVTSRNLEGEDVTEQYIDVDARVKNKIVLRDRLKQLLDKATDVKDILAIETELNRVQADIDSMEGKIKSLKGKVDYATIKLNIERKPILGPLGYVFKGLFWGIEKLFVISD